MAVRLGTRRRAGGRGLIARETRAAEKVKRRNVTEVARAPSEVPSRSRASVYVTVVHGCREYGNPPRVQRRRRFESQTENNKKETTESPIVRTTGADVLVHRVLAGSHGPGREEKLWSILSYDDEIRRRWSTPRVFRSVPMRSHRATFANNVWRFPTSLNGWRTSSDGAHAFAYTAVSLIRLTPRNEMRTNYTILYVRRSQWNSLERDRNAPSVDALASLQ